MRFLLLTTLLLSFFGNLQAQSFDQPVEYMNFFSREFGHIQTLQMEYFGARAHFGDEAGEQVRQKMLARAKTMIQRLENVTPYADDQGIKANAVATIQQLYETSVRNHQGLAAKAAGCDDCFPRVLEEIELLRLDDDRIETLMDAFIQSMKDFAANHNITFEPEDNPRTAAIKKVSRTHNYLQQVRVAVLEVQYADGDVVDALNARDIPLARQQAEALLEASANAVRRLSDISRIREDSDLMAKTRRLIDAYRKAAQYLYPKMLDAFDADGALPNDQVDFFNQSIETLDRNIQNLTQAQAEAEQALEQFHMPKPKGS